jgi:hypothetical protein
MPDTVRLGLCALESSMESCAKRRKEWRGGGPDKETSISREGLEGSYVHALFEF